jgi:ATP-dependent DNA helicase DinG
VTEAATSPRSAEALLGRDGPFARALPRYEAREGQLEMARRVERALAREHVLLCEAGTGTGKTLAYLLPAILSGKKVVVSTATRTLQEQIFDKDLPLIERALDRPISAALMKGLSNYVCLRRLAELEKSPAALEHRRALQVVLDFVQYSRRGDIGELPGLPEDEPIWREVTSSSDTRVGPQCPYYDGCFVTRMKQEAEQSRLIVVNHHLFFADLALRGAHPGRVLPDYDAVIFDEAHLLEDIATDFFGQRVSSARFERLARETERAFSLLGGADAVFGPDDGRRALEEIRYSAGQFWDALANNVSGQDGRITLERDSFVGPVVGAWHRLDDALERLSSFASALAGRMLDRAAKTTKLQSALMESLEVGARRAEQLRSELGEIIEGGPGRVTWLDRGTRAMSLSSSPVDVSDLFRERLFKIVPSVVLTSATLAIPGTGQSDAGSGFSFIRNRLGLTGPDAVDVHIEELVVRSPFDFPANALLYTPRDLPAPNDPNFIDRAVDCIAELVSVTDGGCFVLTTSLRSMRALHNGLRARLAGRRLLLQGQAPKSALISSFRAAENAVLVATLSFWQGVDVPGHALRLVVLEKVPFAVPTDPVLVARSAALQAEGGNPFVDLYVPAAAITLKQGFGRLIRTQTDRGIVALLDTRVLSRGYGKRLLAALPDVGRTSELSGVRSFWKPTATPN